jgi:pimeloyl-ACP methyl ester carboxylesterase
MSLQNRPHHRTPRWRELKIPIAGEPIAADLSWPNSRGADAHRPSGPHADGLVIFCHGSGSNRFSPRNRIMASMLQEAGLATMLIDLEPIHAGGHNNRLADLPLLSRRLLTVIDWTAQQADLRDLPLALFGSSTGAAVALEAAAARPERIRALVSRGGRPDLALPCLSRVCCPILLLVGEHDLDVLELNAWAAAQLQVRHDLVVIPGAGHLFSEPGCLESMGRLACHWLQQELAPKRLIRSRAGDAGEPAVHLQRLPSDCSASAE